MRPSESSLIIVVVFVVATLAMTFPARAQRQSDCFAANPTTSSSSPSTSVGSKVGDFMAGANQKCSVENASWPVPPNINPKCYRCFCKDLIVHCAKKYECESLCTCPVVLADDCCRRKCKTCEYLGERYVNDEQWLSTQDTCRTLTCKGGVVTIARMECMTPCANAESVVGFCCPLCPIAKNNSLLLSHWMEVVRDPCVQCQCDNRWCHCFKTACPALDCLADQQYLPEGKCCPECRNYRTESGPLSNGRCIFQGMMYKNEHSFRPDKCTLCKCQDGTVVCRRFVCPVSNCPKQRLYHDKDLCCPKCRDSDPSPCIYHNVHYDNGDQWTVDDCTRCSCNDGNVDCSTTKCALQQCPRGYRLTPVPGRCCPECEEAESTCTVFGDPHYQTFDGRSFNFQGACRYVLTKVCDKGYNDETDLPYFTVVVQNEPRGNDNYAWTRHVSIRLPNGVRLALLPGKQVRLNRKLLKIPHVEIDRGSFSVMYDRQNNLLMRLNQDLKIVWDGNSYVEATLSKRYRGRVCGLCGNYNNNSKDDLTTSDGQLSNSVYSFGQSWRIGSWKACKSAKDRHYHEKLERERKRRRKLVSQRLANFNDWRSKDRMSLYFPNDKDAKAFLASWKKELILGKLAPRTFPWLEETDRRSKEIARTGTKSHHRKRQEMKNVCSGGSAKWRTRRAAIEQCRLLESPLFASCHAAVPVKRYYRSCVMDTCACPPSGRCFCESLLAYARQCEKENINIDWRAHSKCNIGDSQCSIQGAIFSPCAPSCVLTCSTWNRARNQTVPMPCSTSVSTSDEQCVPGCHCPNGTAQLLNQCLPVDLCPSVV